MIKQLNDDGSSHTASADNKTTAIWPTDDDDNKTIWQQCASSFHRSKANLLTHHFVDPAVQEHMKVPPILATLDDELEPMAVHYFPVGGDGNDSDSEVECIVLPSSLPLTYLQRDHSSDGGVTLRRYSLEPREE